jgi:hypothetical protein
MVLEELHGLEGSSTSNELVREFGLVVRLVVTSILVIDLLVSLLGVVYGVVS